MARALCRSMLLAFLCLSLPACDGEREDDDDGEDDDGREYVQEVSTDVCREGLKWAGGDEESALMHPGADCIGCHTRVGEGPRYVIAGTVYADAREPDDCFGVPGALVEITDAEGSTWKLPTNAAGNFFLEQEDGPVVMPYTAVVTVGDMQRPMAAEQTTGACGSCHTVEGLNLAPGRIVTP